VQKRKLFCLEEHTRENSTKKQNPIPKTFFLCIFYYFKYFFIFSTFKINFILGLLKILERFLWKPTGGSAKLREKRGKRSKFITWYEHGQMPN